MSTAEELLEGARVAAAAYHRHSRMHERVTTPGQRHLVRSQRRAAFTPWWYILDNVWLTTRADVL